MGADNWLQESRLDSRFAPLLQLGSLAILDFTGLILAANQSFCEMLGYPSGDLVGRKVLEVTYPEDRDLGRELMRQAMAGEIQNYSLEKRYLRRDGSHFWAQLSGAILSDPQTGQPQYFASMIQDIDARKKAEFALAEAESRWHFALESAGQGVWDYRVAEGKTFYSKTWKAIIGYEENEIADAGELWQSFVHPDDLPRVMASDKDHLAGLTPYFECEFRMRHKQGHWVWISDRGKVIARAAYGRPLRMIGTHTDISARKAADDAIRETGERYRLLADNSTDMIMRVRKSGRRVYVSPACRRLLGWEPEEMLDIPTSGALHPEDVASLTAQWLGGFESDEAMVLTYRMRRKDGGYVWVESISRALPVAPNEKPERILVVRDIDRRVAAEQKLKDSEARHRLLAEFATDMVFQLDCDLVRSYVSPACREILGYEPEELLGIAPAAMAHPDDAERVAGIFGSLIAGDLERASISNRIRHRDGRWVWVDTELRLLRDAQRGTPTGIIGSLRDASKRKEAEDRLEQDNRQLASQAAKDGLTGLLNRRSFDEALDREFRRAKRESTPLGLVMIDVDKFKSFNDLYGHPAGDACLRSVSAAIAGMLQRPGDSAARYGGEEFAVLLPNTDEAGAIEVAERIRIAVKELKRQHSGTRRNCVTISAGAAAIASGATLSSADGLVQAADCALYAAKHAGRDHVIGATSLDRAVSGQGLPLGEARG
jgi:diguanylate cyclase (GGDEF)-like protein/PAS domain S-box-containing protein